LTNDPQGSIDEPSPPARRQSSQLPVVTGNLLPVRENAATRRLGIHQGEVMNVRTTERVRNQDGATTAEYAVCTGAGVGFAGLLFKLLTSDVGQKVIGSIFDHVLKMLPF